MPIIEWNLTWIMIIAAIPLAVFLYHIKKAADISKKISNDAADISKKICSTTDNVSKDATDVSKKICEVTTTSIVASAKPEDIENNFKIIQEFMKDVGGYISKSKYTDEQILANGERMDELIRLIKEAKVKQ